MHSKAKCTTAVATMAVLALLSMAASRTGGAAPPLPTGKLTTRQQQRLTELARARTSTANAGKMGEASRLAREIVVLWWRWQGAGHWQAVNARYEAETWQRLARLGEADQKEIGRAMRLGDQARALISRGRYAEAEKTYRAALAIRIRILGADDLDTAVGYNNVAICLDALGKQAQALAEYEKVLTICKKSLGEEHPSTAAGYNNVAYCLNKQGKLVEALPLFEKALAIRKRALGERHPDTAASYNNVSACLIGQGQYARAQPLAEQALALRKVLLGEMNLATAVSYNNLAACLNGLGRHAQALPLCERSLTIRKGVMGELHPSTARCYNNLATCFLALGQCAHALPLCEKALAACRKVLGERHAETALAYNNLAACLNKQGKHAEALPLFEKALAVRRNALGELHPETAASYSHTASCLQAHGKYAEALSYCEKALAIYKKVRGEGHPDVAAAYNSVAGCLNVQGNVAETLRHCEKALGLHKKVLGEEHPATAGSYHNLASCLDSQGKHAEALPLFEKALAIYTRTLGEQHPETANTYNSLAYCLYAQGKYRQAIRHWQAALPGHDAGRLARASTGFDRALAGADRNTPPLGLALAYAHLGQAASAWGHTEAGLARNLLDDRAGGSPEDASLPGNLRRLDERLVAFFGVETLLPEQVRLRDELARQRQDVLARLDKLAAGRSGELLWPLERVQKHLPADAAVVLWVGLKGENWACALRSRGAPRWQRLTGTGPKGVWTADDNFQLHRLQEALADAGSSAARRRDLTEAVRRRWLAPLLPHLAADGDLPAVRRLFVVPTRYVATLPAAVVAAEYVVSYTPSATLLAQGLASHRPLRGAPALALGDPVFSPAPPAEAPPAGLLVTEVLAGGGAERSGLRPGDVLLRFGDARLKTVNDLAAALKSAGRAQAIYWRDGKEYRTSLAGPLGVRLDRRPAPAAVAAWRMGNASVTRGERYEPLPGTRAEVLALKSLLGGGCRTLLGGAASEQALDGLARKGELRTFRLLHLATHATVDPDRPERSAVVLARDRLPGVAENAERAARGLRPYTGELTVDAILRGWKLDADLVVLSACRTGLGRPTSGEGLLGFPYALLKAGARSVVLSRWKVDDTATALFMLRFYENLLGKRKGLKEPLDKAEALTEAAKWLRELPRKDAERLAAGLGQGRLAGTARGSLGELKLKHGEVKLPVGDRPYAHPYYWAAFTLLGDPG